MQNTTASRQAVHPFLQVFGAISNKGTYLDESRPPLFEPPPSEGREAHVDLLGDFLFCQKILHGYLTNFMGRVCDRTFCLVDSALRFAVSSR